jgi:hypothetical protein
VREEIPFEINPPEAKPSKPSQTDIMKASIVLSMLAASVMAVPAAAPFPDPNGAFLSLTGIERLPLSILLSQSYLY